MKKKKDDTTPLPKDELQKQLKRKSAALKQLKRKLEITAETHAREAKIEAALERTRTQSMIMQHSKELDDTLRVFHEQVLLLGIHSAFSFLWLPDEKNDRHIFWAAWKEGKNGSTVFKSKAINYPLDRNEPATAQCLLDWKSNEPVYSYHVPPAAVENYFAVWQELIDGVEQLKPEYFSGGLYYVEAFMKYGCFGVIVANDLTEDEKKILGRFAIEFERTYTRFLDLQKAETQAREAKIQLSLERVRARTMAMQNSSELPDAANLLFQQAQSLDMPAWSAGYCIWDEDKKAITLWMSSEGVLQPPFRAPLTEDPSFIHFREAHERGETFFVDEIGGEELVKHYKYMRTLPVVGEILDWIIEAGHPLPTFQIFHLAFFSQGFLLFITYEPVPEAHDIFKRFAKVFEQTYTRFLDLQKAETQAREAQIEVALEKVRSRSLSVHKSDEFKEVIKVIFERLQELGFQATSVSINTFIKNSNDTEVFICGQSEIGKVISDFRLPYFNSLISNDRLAAQKNNMDFFSKTYNKEEKNLFYDLAFELSDLKLVPDEIKKMVYASKLYTISLALAKNSMVVVNDFAGNILSENEIDIIKRFARVFEQAYIRFLDLQKAEAQSREAQIELGLERVRARALAMQKSDELSELVDTVFKELTKLDFALTWCIINIIDESSMSNTVWAANPDINKMLESYHMLFEDYPFHHAMMKGYKERATKYIYVLEGAEKKVYDEYLFNETEFRKVPEAAKAASSAMEKYVVSFSFSNFGGLQTVGDVPLSDANLNILSRFGKVFDLTYTRFNDLKQAETQARESQIQLALERVRARTMAMQKSDELKYAATLLFQQAKTLGVPAYSCGYNIWEKEGKEFTSWMSTQDGSDINGVPNIPLTEDANFIRYVESKQNAEPFFVLELRGKRMQEHYAYLKTIPAFKTYFDYAVSVGFDLPETQIHHLANFMQGNLLFITLEPCPEFHDVFKRFAAVFEQTYTRFLDLQNAETQARESQIQLALERVRARTMAMQKSDELSETVFILFQQFKQLGENPDQATIGIINEAEWVIEYWVTMYGNQTNRVYKFPIDEPNVTNRIYKAWKEQKKSLVIELSGKELYDFATFRESVGGAAYNREEKKRVINVAFFSKGIINVQSNESRSAESIRLLERFAAVFEQTYTRFLDLKKAEAQAREAQIEAALEKVRSRSMGMQKSEELKEVIQVVYDQFVQLNIHIEHTGFVMDYKARDDYDIWIADPLGVPSQVTVPYFDSVYYNRFNEAKEKGEDFFATNLDFEEKNRFYQKLFEYVPGLPEDAKEFYFSCPGLAASTVLLENVCLYMENFSGTPYSDEENNTLMRFGKVFQQTYTRFLDLQKAEAQAREAQIEAALERVRSRSMGMQKSDELTDVAGLLFAQVNVLGIKTWTAGFNVWSEDNNSYVDYITSPAGGFIEPYTVHSEVTEILTEVSDARKSGVEFFVQFAEGERLKQTYLALSRFGDEKQYEIMLQDGFQFPSHQYDHFVFGSKVSLMFITYDPVPESHDIFKRFGKVFEQTYTRFLDIQKAEAQALEAIKRASVDRVRAEIASMRTTNDLERIQPLIWNELTTLGVRFIRCGVFIMDEETQQVQTMLSTPDGKAIATLHVPFEFDLSIISNGVEYWGKRKMYAEHWDAVAFTKSWIKLSSLRDTSMDSPQAEHPPENLYLYMLPFLQGMLYVGNDVSLNENELQLVQNLADAFSTAYARYEDFNKLESANVKIEKTLVDLKQTQAQLVQSEKMASLGELTAGIAHEIQNPLNFVNNFSEVNTELIDEMVEEVDKGNTEEAKAIANDIKQNLEKINHHGRRADAIVKGMLQHSRSSNATKEPTDINKLADEYLRLAYHGLRAKDKSFNATMNTDFDETIEKINIIPQDIGRVLLNLYNNAFYAVKPPNPLKGEHYEPTVTVSTKLLKPPSGGLGVRISVTDNGNGIPQKVVDKIFQPFFTTKPTGQGTGLGLSLTYDIIKAHGGEIKVETKEGEGSEFIIILPSV